MENIVRKYTNLRCNICNGSYRYTRMYSTIKGLDMHYVLKDRDPKAHT